MKESYGNGLWPALPARALSRPERLVPGRIPDRVNTSIAHENPLSHAAATGKDGHPKWYGVIHLRWVS